MSVAEHTNLLQAELEHRQLARQAMGMLNSALEDRKGGTKHVILEGPVVEVLVRCPAADSATEVPTRRSPTVGPRELSAGEEEGPEPCLL